MAPPAVATINRGRQRAALRRVALPVHQHLMPIVQHNRGMVRMPHTALGIEGRVTLHRPPAATSGLPVARQHVAVLPLRQAAGIALGDVHRFHRRSDRQTPANAPYLRCEQRVRYGAPASDQPSVRQPERRTTRPDDGTPRFLRRLRRRSESPKRASRAATPGGLRASIAERNSRHAPAGNGCHEPVPLVVAAEELVLLRSGIAPA